MARLRIGVAGCGAIAQIMHLPHLREMDDLFELVAIADADAETLELVGEHYGVSRRHRSIDGLLEQPVDALLILTPGSHAPQCIAAAQAGKHVFVEKPLAYTVQECDAIARAVDAAGVTLQVGYMKRYDPAYVLAQPLVAALKDLRYVQITTIHPSSNLFWAHHAIRRHRGEPPIHPYTATPYPWPITVSATDLARMTILTSICHDVNALRGLIGEPVAVLSCEARHQGGTITTLFEYPGDLLVNLSFAYVPDLRDYREELAFYGGTERVRVVFPSPFLRNMPTELFHHSQNGETRIVVGYEEAFAEELRAFHQNVTTGARPTTDVADSRADLVVMTDMSRLAATRAR